ncbi:MAG TPA: vitamin K epoxide reductase family protein [Burkholderiales bacterium]|nr:vitamin K epoxide reductase family protein [Burkholderiales bacterium]
MIALALIGITDAFYDSYAIYSGQPLWCPPPIDGCNIVAASPYARILGVPLGYLGLAFYLAMLGLAAGLRSAPGSRSLRWVALLYTGAGLGASIYFFYVQRTYIHAFCIYCLVSGVLALLLFIAANLHFRASRADAPRVPHEAAASAT